MILLTHERQWRGGETVVAFGMFDGVHEGHAQLMRRANELAALYDLKSVVYTFSSHPMATYAPDRVPPQLETRSEKIRSIAQLGLDVAVLRPFDKAYAAQSPEEFVQAFVSALHPKHVVIGFNYSFGKMGAGKAEDMRRFGAANSWGASWIFRRRTCFGPRARRFRRRAFTPRAPMSMKHGTLRR